MVKMMKVIFIPRSNTYNKMEELFDIQLNIAERIQNWIKLCESEPPEEIKSIYSSVLYSERVQIARTWIERVKTEPPEWILDGIIERNNTDSPEPPERWRRSISMRNANAHSLATCWVQYVKTDPPVWMRYDPDLIVDGYTIARTWGSIR
jgi:hypothetical protein